MKEFNNEIYKRNDLYIQHLKILDRNVVSKSIGHPNYLARRCSCCSQNIPTSDIKGSIPTTFLKLGTLAWFRYL